MAGKIKILMTGDTVGGVWTYCMQLCRALKPYGVEVHLCTMGGLPGQAQLAEAGSISNVILYPGRYKLEWMEGYAEDAGEARQWLKSICDEVQPDVIHFNNYGQSVQQWDCPTITVYHSCVQTWWQAVHNETPPAAWQPYTAIVEGALAKSDMVVFPSRAMLHQAEAAFGRLKKATVIYNGIDAAITPITDKEPFILAAGRVWDEAKNIGLLCRIADVLPWPVYIAGENSGFKGSSTLKNVHFLGQLAKKEMQAVMAKAAIFVMPSKYEPFGLAALEAAAAGCALALSDIPTFRELWGEAGVYFHPFEDELAIKAINRLINDSGLRAANSENAKQRAALYTAGKMANEYYSLYRKLYKQQLTVNTAI